MTPEGEEKKKEPDELFSKMNSYHPNINITIEINPSKSKLKSILK